MRILTREPDCIAPIRNLSSLILSCQAWIPPLRLLLGTPCLIFISHDFFECTMA